MVGRLVWWLFKWTIIIVVLVFLINFWLHNKSYIFSDEAVAAIAKKHIAGTDAHAMYKKIYSNLQKKYPGHILPEKELQWIFVNAGGWMGSMCLLHASLTEYVLFFGTPIATSGHSGLYWANISDTVLTGTMRNWVQGSVKANVYNPGDVVYHKWGTSAAVDFSDGLWMVEYGRGFIPSTLGFALADTVFSTQDFATLFYTVRITAKAWLMEANIYVAQVFDYVKSQLV